MSVLHLLWIVPVCMITGYVLCAILTANRED